MNVPLEYWKQQLEMHQYTVTELERMWHETFDELKSLEEYHSEMADYLGVRDRLLNEMRDYRTAIHRNKSTIKRIEIIIANSTK